MLWDFQDSVIRSYIITIEFYFFFLCPFPDLAYFKALRITILDSICMYVGLSIASFAILNYKAYFE